MSRFGVPLHVVTDRGTQFESALFSQLATMLGFHRLRTTAYHPKTNGMVERLHRTLKTAITARRKQWLQALPVVLLSIRATANESGFAPFTAVTGSLLLHPRIGVDRQPPTDSASETVRELAQQMSRTDFLTLSDGNHHSVTREYLPLDLSTCTHVWLRVDRVRRPLEAPYVGPLRVRGRSGRWFQLELPSGKTDTVSVERLKPACLPRQSPPPLTPDGDVTARSSPAPTRAERPERLPEASAPLASTAPVRTATPADSSPVTSEPDTPVPPRRSRRLAQLPVLDSRVSDSAPTPCVTDSAPSALVPDSAPSARVTDSAPDSRVTDTVQTPRVPPDSALSARVTDSAPDPRVTDSVRTPRVPLDSAPSARVQDCTGPPVPVRTRAGRVVRFRVPPH